MWPFSWLLEERDFVRWPLPGGRTLEYRAAEPKTRVRWWQETFRPWRAACRLHKTAKALLRMRGQPHDDDAAYAFIFERMGQHTDQLGYARATNEQGFMAHNGNPWNLVKTKGDRR